MKPEICFISLSTLPSLPVLRRVVMAKVAIERFELVISVSISGLHVWTTWGLKEATVCKILMAENLVIARGEDRNRCKVCMAWVISLSWTSRRLHIALAASKFTISFLSRSQLSRSCSIGFRRLPSSSINFAAIRTSMTVAGGLRIAPAAPYCCTIFTKAIRSCDLI